MGTTLTGLPSRAVQCVSEETQHAPFNVASCALLILVSKALLFAHIFVMTVMKREDYKRGNTAGNTAAQLPKEGICLYFDTSVLLAAGWGLCIRGASHRHELAIDVQQSDVHHFAGS